jgi:hypothetical protein
MDKKATLSKLAESRNALLQSIFGLEETDIINIPVEGVWTIKDLLSHITSWELVTLAPMRHFVETGIFDPEPIPDHLIWNDEQARLWQRKSMVTVMQELEAVRREILDQAELLTISQWEHVVTAPWGGEGTLAEILSGLAWHENEHVNSIERWRHNQ